MLTIYAILSILANVIVTMILALVIIQVLAMFDVINLRQPFVAGVYTTLRKILDPILDPIRRILPDTGMLDLSPLVLLLGLQILMEIIRINAT